MLLQRTLLLGFTTALLAGCGPGALMTAKFLGGEAGGMWLTKPSAPPPADLSKQMAQHQTWCYTTLGTPECYTCPQDVPPGRLINVDPPNLYPMSYRDYEEAVANSRPAQAAQGFPAAPEPLLVPPALAAPTTPMPN